MNTMSKRRKVVAIGAAGVLAASGLGGVYAAWTESVSTQVQNLTAGTGTITLSAGNLIATTDSSVSDIVPGDTITRSVTVTSSTTYTLKSISMSVAATGDSELLTGLDSGSVDQLGQLTAVVTDDASNTLFTGPAENMAFTNTSEAVLAGHGASTTYTVAITFPSTATNADKGKAAHFTYTFQAVQRDGAAK